MSTFIRLHTHDKKGRVHFSDLASVYTAMLSSLYLLTPPLGSRHRMNENSISVHPVHHSGFEKRKKSPCSIIGVQFRVLINGMLEVPFPHPPPIVPCMEETEGHAVFSFTQPWARFHALLSSSSFFLLFFFFFSSFFPPFKGRLWRSLAHFFFFFWIWVDRFSTDFPRGKSPPFFLFLFFI